MPSSIAGFPFLTGVLSSTLRSGPFHFSGQAVVRLLGVVAAFGVLSGQASAQELPIQLEVTPADQMVEVVLTDGTVLVGRITETGDPFRFVLVSGVEMTIPMANLSEVSAAEGIVDEGEYWRLDPNRTRLFFGPTARTPKAGDGYFAVYQIVMPFLGVGVTDSFLLAGGTPLIFGDETGRPFWIAPKLRVYNSEKTQAAVGVLAVNWDDENFGLMYGVVTRGDERSSLTAGLAYGYADGDLADTPVLMVGGEVRMSRSMKLITENYLFPGEGGLLSLGPRFFGRNLSADLGLVVPVGGDEFIVLPLINFVYNF